MGSLTVLRSALASWVTTVALQETIEMLAGAGAGKKVGTLVKERHKGKLVDEWTKM